LPAQPLRSRGSASDGLFEDPSGQGVFPRRM